MSPEQLKGAEVTAKSDIYALGLVLYELFTGKRPLRGQERAATDRPAGIGAAHQHDVHRRRHRSRRGEGDPPMPRSRIRSKRPADRACGGSGAARAATVCAAAWRRRDAVARKWSPPPAQTEGLARRYSRSRVLILVALCLFGSRVVNQRREAIQHSALEESPEVLAHRSRDLAAALGYARKPADSFVRVEARIELVRILRRTSRTAAMG